MRRKQPALSRNRTDMRLGPLETDRSGRRRKSVKELTQARFCSLLQIVQGCDRGGFWSSSLRNQIISHHGKTCFQRAADTGGISASAFGIHAAAFPGGQLARLDANADR